MFVGTLVPCGICCLLQLPQELETEQESEQISIADILDLCLAKRAVVDGIRKLKLGFLVTARDLDFRPAFTHARILNSSRTEAACSTQFKLKIKTTVGAGISIGKSKFRCLVTSV